MNKRIIPCLYLENGQAVKNFEDRTPLAEPDPERLAAGFGNDGADEVLVFDFSSGDREQEQALEEIKKICAAAEVPVIGAGNVKRMEDVKKLIYAGCRRAGAECRKGRKPGNFKGGLPEVRKREDCGVPSGSGGLRQRRQRDRGVCRHAVL